MSKLAKVRRFAISMLGGVVGVCLVSAMAVGLDWAFTRLGIAPL